MVDTKKNIVIRYLSKGLSYGVVLSIIIYVGQKMNDNVCLAITGASFMAGALLGVIDRLNIVAKTMEYVQGTKQEERIEITTTQIQEPQEPNDESHEPFEVIEENDK